MRPFIEHRFALLGCGSLGESLLQGLLALQVPAQQITVTSRRIERRNALSARYQVNTTDQNDCAAQDADIVLLCAKPQQFAVLLHELAAVSTNPERLWISVAAGIEVRQITHALGSPDTAVVRAMPNTPAALKHAATGLFASAGVSGEQRQLSETLFDGIGCSVWLADEKWMNWVTALSGSGPAYFYQLMADMIAAAVAAGFPRDAAELLVKQTALGAAHMATDNTVDSLDELIRRVRSPGGTTEKALNTLADHDFAGIIADMLTAAETRGRYLSEQLQHTTTTDKPPQ